MTQMQYALKGTITKEMMQVATNEELAPEWICSEVAAGRITIPKNINHNFDAVGIGNGLRTKINANIGTSEKHCNQEEEIRKLDISIKYGADSIMDLSTGGDLQKILERVIKHSPVMVGTVPIYKVMANLLMENKTFSQMKPDDIFSEIERQAIMGVDFMTLHCGVTRNSLSFLKNDERILGIVSRGGSLLRRWMEKNNAENPLFEQYDRVLDICEKYDVTISLGDGLRPGAGADASDRGQFAELLILGELVDRARARGVQVIVEGPGHMPLDQIEMNIKLMKKICKQAPFYVLGPLTTDIAPGYDHIVGAIGGAIAAAAGVDFLCYLTPAEHLCLPDEEDVKQGVIASRIAAQSGDIVKGVKSAIRQNNAMSKARRDLNWEAMFNCAIDPEQARKRKSSSESADEDHCTMCGNLCAIKTDRDI
ncbi:MAG: phosphomethylpyrimidine synthase ThiC [Bacteroidetes bacterium]|nr:phosphomethylpyrimidine synthase ThiC [Bacteroidota bacterium]